MNEKIQYRTRPPSAVLKISSSLLVNECGVGHPLTIIFVVVVVVYNCTLKSEFL